MPKGSPGKDSENIQLEPLARTPKHVESADSTEADAKVPLRRSRKTCDSGMFLCCIILYIISPCEYILSRMRVYYKIRT